MVSLYGYIGYKIFIHTQNQHPFILGDWLISYQDGGFRRRGLSGEVFFLLQDITALPLEFLVGFAQLICLSIIFYGIIHLIIKNYASEPLYFLLFLLPTTLLFWVNDEQTIGRKELILFSIFILFIKTRLYILTGILLAISTLFHELTIFFIPYFIFIMLIRNENIFSKNTIFLSIWPILSFGAIYLFGDVHFSNGNVMTILAEKGITKMSNVLIDYKDPAKIAISVKSLSYIYHIIFTFIILFLYELLYKSKVKIAFLYLLGITLSLPLFLLAVDWGRWIFIHSLMSVILLTTAEQKSGYSKHINIIKALFVSIIFIGFTLRMANVANGLSKSLLYYKIIEFKNYFL